MDTDALVQDYLGRLDTAGAALPAGRRADLIGQVREHIEAATAEAGGSDEVTVRNILDRLGSPDEIVAAEAAQMPAPETAVPASAAAVGLVETGGSGLGAVEVAATVSLALAWPALLLLPYGLAFWIGFGIVGLILVWASRTWTQRFKMVTTGVVVALYVVLVLVTAPVTVTCTTGNPPVACPPGGPQPIETSFPS